MLSLSCLFSVGMFDQDVNVVSVSVWSHLLLESASDKVLWS